MNRPAILEKLTISISEVKALSISVDECSKPYTWGSVTSFKHELSAIQSAFVVKTLHRRGHETLFFKPDLREVLLQIPIKDGEIWICT